MEHANRVGRADIDGKVRVIRIEDDIAVPLDLDGGLPTGLLMESGRLWTASPAGAGRRVEDIRLLAPLISPGKIVAIGLNYVDHAVESAQELPTEPLVFAKFPSAVIGPGEAITFERALTDGVDIEAELAVVIGTRTRSVGPAEALARVGAYTCLNDVSARDLQFRDGQWVRGKSLDTFCPIGPWLVHPEAFGVPGTQRIQGIVSGDVWQDARLADMVFDVGDLISRLSHSFTLEPGDVIATGTPPGVGWFQNPRKTLHDGDVVTISIGGIGSLVNPVRAVR